MVWDKDRPTDQERIHDLGSAIRPNWKAIEEASDSDTIAQKLKLWAINLIDRSQPAVTGPDTPDRIDDTGQLYCRNKGDPGDFNELFFEDSQNPSKEVQLTQDGELGSADTGLITNSITFNTTDVDIISAWGYFDSAGILLASKNMNDASNVSPGIWDITTTAVMANANVGISLSTFRPPSDTPASINVVTAPSFAASQVSLRIETKNRAGSHVDLSFYVLIIGGV